MNKCIAILLSLSFACNNQNNKTQKPNEDFLSNVRSTVINNLQNNEVAINLEESLIFWKGTKLTGKHEGTVKLSKGLLMFNEDKLTGGTLTVSMETINITDIPEDEPVPRRNLMNHFIDEFAINQYPTASFSFNQVEYVSSNKIEIIGNLKIKGNSRAIKITAVKKNDQYISEFSFNRFNWGIGEDGSWFAKKFVDEEIQLKVVLVPLNK